MPRKSGRGARKPRRTKRSKRPRRVGGKRYAARSSGRAVRKYTSIIRPITLNPKFQMKRMQYYNTCNVQMGLGQSGSQADIIKSTVPIFFKVRLNSPYIVSDFDTMNPQASANSPFSQYTGSTHWNNPIVPHSNTDSIETGSQYEGWSGPGSPAFGYSQYCVLGTKVSASYTPIGNLSTSASGSGGQPGGAQPTGFFGFIETNTVDGIKQVPRTSNPTTIGDIYKKPYCKVAKILPTKTAGGSAGNISYAGGANSATLTFNYSPKRMNGVKDLADNQQLWGGVRYDGVHGTQPSVQHPNEGDYLTIGWIPLMDDHGAEQSQSSGDPQQMQSGMLQIRMETVVAFREPINGQAEFAAGNVAMATGGDSGAAAAIGAFAGGFARGAVGL